MARTESKTLTCHPAAEREIVEVHEKFHWSLTNSQDVKTVNQGLEKGGWLDDNVYSVRRTEHYVKLTFSREIDLPNLGEIKKLENAYFGLPTGDAIFAQRPLLEVLKEHGCNYLFQLKENQGDAYETVEYCFKEAPAREPDAVSYSKKKRMSSSENSGATLTLPTICATH